MTSIWEADERATARWLAMETQLFGVPIYESGNVPNWWDIFIGGQHNEQPGPMAAIEKCVIVGELGHFKHVLWLYDQHGEAAEQLQDLINEVELRWFGSLQEAS